MYNREETLPCATPKQASRDFWRVRAKLWDNSVSLPQKGETENQKAPNRGGFGA